MVPDCPGALVCTSVSAPSLPLVGTLEDLRGGLQQLPSVLTLPQWVVMTIRPGISLRTGMLRSLPFAWPVVCPYAFALRAQASTVRAALPLFKGHSMGRLTMSSTKPVKLCSKFRANVNKTTWILFVIQKPLLSCSMLVPIYCGQSLPGPQAYSLLGFLMKIGCGLISSPPEIGPPEIGSWMPPLHKPLFRVNFKDDGLLGLFSNVVKCFQGSMLRPPLFRVPPQEVVFGSTLYNSVNLWGQVWYNSAGTHC